jgi:mono/diheme cytochrome c family protein
MGQNYTKPADFIRRSAVRTFFLRAFLISVLMASLAATGILLTAQGNPEAAKVTNPIAATTESLATGKQVYQRYCATCHGINAEGGSGSDISPPAPDLTDSEWKRGSTDGEIFSVIKNGVPPDLNMEPWGDRIKDTDIWNVVNYVRSLAKKK